MKVLSYDCFSGISGDMNLGAMIDLGISKDFLISELNKLNLQGWELIAVRDQRHGISGTKVTVKQTRHEHAHRHLEDIEDIVRNSSLDENTRSLAMKIFMKIAEAEAKVHGMPVEHVHFHEVGAIDSIIDVVGAAICYNALNVEGVHVSTVELGSGFVKCDHGKLPVPAPATAEIVKGLPVKQGGLSFEATTPTGAAILAVLGTNFTKGTALKIEKTGYGVGQKENNDIPNLLRVFIAETDVAEPGHDATLLECNIDDMNPEFFEFISEKLFKAGAADVYLTNIMMKKGRPGIVLSIICENENSESLKEILFQESTTLGIRTFKFRKDTLTRQPEVIDTEFGKINIKRSFYKGKEVSVKPEYDDCKRVAMEKVLPLKEVYNKVLSILHKK
ncbi:MAG TPA: nickel pincer cofactor biosynthesis protein LarC [Bacteroidales bacterium]|nr:nickel pincer cofactor biosynthesis protein LarC [Bacteroidales bacterium]